jgi:hypothetical protein
MRKLDRYGHLLPPWPTMPKLVTCAVATGAAVVWLANSAPALHVWSSLVSRRDVLAGTLLSVHASLLGFAVATFAIILSVRGDEKFARLEEFKYASRQMWDALNSASWATAAASLNALIVMVLTSGQFAPWFEHVLAASVFITTLYVVLTMSGVLAVVHALVVILRPAQVGKATTKKIASSSDPTAFQKFGPPSED